MSMYNRLFTKILDSSIWLEPLATRVVWITLLAAMDEDGFASFACSENLARRAGVDLPDCEKALECFMSPDKRAPEQEHEGRRIERVPGGYMVLNAIKYRNLFTREIQREQTRKRVERFRQKSKCNDPVTPCNASVTPANAPVTQSVSSTISESCTKAYRLSTNSPKFQKPSIDDVRKECGNVGLPCGEAEGFWNHHEARGWILGKQPMKSWKAALVTWARNYRKFNSNRTPPLPIPEACTRPVRQTGEIDPSQY